MGRNAGAICERELSGTMRFASIDRELAVQAAAYGISCERKCD
jgi:hypothetical protein